MMKVMILIQERR